MSRFIEFQGGDVEAYLRSQEEKDLLRFITCGSVDDGKSTLIGRLLYEAKMLFEDQLSALEADSKRIGTQGGALDFAPFQKREQAPAVQTLARGKRVPFPDRSPDPLRRLSRCDRGGFRF